MHRSRPRAYADPGEYSDARSSVSRSGASEEEQDSQPRREKKRRTSRSRSPSSPVHYRRRERRERSDSRSRSRSRSTTPERYERSLRRASSHREERGRGYDYGRGRGGYHHHQHRHQEHYGPHLPGGGGGYKGYERRGGGYVHSRGGPIEDGRDNPNPSKCLGVFGMPSHVCEQDLRNMFEPFGKIDRVHVVINRDTGECRGYGFVYYESVEEAKRARTAMRDAKIDGIAIRVDFSVSQGPRRSFRD